MQRPAPGSALVQAEAAMPAEGVAKAGTGGRSLDLEELLERAKQGDEGAFGELVRRFEKMVYGHVYRLTGRAESSEDISQDVFLQLWRVLPAFTTSAALGSWLKRVLVNAVISHWRQQDSQRRRLQAMQEAFPTVSQLGPVATLIDEEDRDEVRAALDTMPADLRSILMLRVYEGLSYEELAESLELEVGTVRSRLFRARQVLKEVLERWREHGRGGRKRG